MLFKTVFYFVYQKKIITYNKNINRWSSKIIIWKSGGRKVKRRKVTKRVLGVTLAAVTALSFTACGKQEEKQEEPVAYEEGELGA